jgi:predicted kinase
MEKLTDKQFLLLVNGPSCGGKSTVIDILFDKYSDLFKAKSDAIKWLISGYQASVQRHIVHEMTFQAAWVALSNGLSVLKEGAMFEPEKYLQLAESLKLPVFVANVEAPWEVLIARFEERLKAREDGTRKMANIDPGRFKEIYDSYHSSKMPSTLQFDSSRQLPEEVAETIAEYIRTH